MAAANSKAQSLRESLGVTAAYISWIVRGFSPPHFEPGYEKVSLLFQNRGHAEVLKKTPSSAKYVTKVRPPSVPECPSPPPPPPPGPLTLEKKLCRLEAREKTACDLGGKAVVVPGTLVFYTILELLVTI